MVHVSNTTTSTYKLFLHKLKCTTSETHVTSQLATGKVRILSVQGWRDGSASKAFHALTEDLNSIPIFMSGGSQPYVSQLQMIQSLLGTPVGTYTLLRGAHRHTCIT